jgi:hypothetical protein
MHSGVRETDAIKNSFSVGQDLLLTTDFQDARDADVKVTLSPNFGHKLQLLASVLLIPALNFSKTQRVSGLSLVAGAGR